MQRCSGHWEIAGYQGEKVVLLAATDSPYSGPASNVSADVRVGMNVDYQAMDFGPVLKRRESSNRRPRAIPGLFCFTPATHSAPLGDGSGRPNDPKMERRGVQHARPHHPEEQGPRTQCSNEPNPKRSTLHETG